VREAAETGPEGGEPRELDWLAEALPINVGAIDQAIQDYLGRFEELGGAVSDLLTGEGVTPWLMGAAIASAGFLAARRMSQKARPEPLLFAGGEASISSWLLDVSSNER